jgi:hypothetical protein
MTREEMVWVVDRIEGERVVLAEDAGGRTAEVGRSGIGVPVREGTVLRVPVADSGTLVWQEARRDEAAERARRDESREILDDPRGQDPGGDVEL